MKTMFQSSVSISMLSLVMAISASAQTAPPAPAPGGPGGAPGAAAGQPGAPRRVPPAPSLLVLSSTAFTDGAALPDKYSDHGRDTVSVNPPFSWTGAPAGTQSFVLMMRDEEYAPNKTFAPYYHWLIFNIPATATSLAEGLPHDKHLADGAVQPQQARGVGYVGTGAPANGQPHHYTFTLYALDTKLDLADDVSSADLSKAMDGHILDKGFLVSRFHKAQ